MAFKNEYVPPLEQENSEFLKKARETLRTGYSKYDAWTVDREHDMVLQYVGGGREMESANLGIWEFIDRKGYYSFTTEQLEKHEPSPNEIAITYKFGRPFTGTPPYALPDAETLRHIKEALQEYARRHLFNLEHYRQCQLTWVDAETGKGI